MDRAGHRPHSYRIASITKMFTAVLTMRLVEQGRLDLGQTVGRYIAGYSGPARNRVTVQQLLNHTSGISNLDASVSSKDGAIRDGVEHYQRPLTSDTLVERYCAGPLVSEPGQKFSYNNCDYILLGKIIERIHGQPYETVLQTELLRPLALSDTGFLRQWEIVDRLAATYITRSGVEGVTHDLPVYWENWYAAGAMYSTVDDLMRFSTALFGGKVLRPSTLDQMLVPGLDRYGYGLWVREDDIAGRKWKSTLRPGSIMGATAVWYHVLAPDLTVIALGNTDEPNLDRFAYGVGSLLIR